MRSVVATFTSRAPDPAAAVATLVAAGFVFELPRGVSRALLDSFDGRVHAAGLRLEACESPRVELILSGPGAVPAKVSVDSVPRDASELLAGPFRTRLAAILEGRALLAVVRLTATRAGATLRDRAGKTVAIAHVHTDVRVDGRDVDGVPTTIEIEELVGYAKPASKARSALAQIGLDRREGDSLDIVAAATGIDLAGFSGSPTVPLDPATPAVDGFRAVLANLADSIDANWQGTADRLDTEFLHDLRVAVRRTRTVVAQGKRVLPPAMVEHARERFAWLGTLTGPARDLDVYLAEWEGYTHQLGPDVIAALEPVRVVLDRRREAAHATLTDALRSADAVEWMNSWRRRLHEPQGPAPQGVHADRPLGKVVARSITRAQAAMIERGRSIRPDTPAAEIHDLRKDAKKLRYLLECFAGMLPKRPRRAFVRRLKALQDNLGEHQDAEVHVAELRAISRELHEHGASPETMLAIGQLTERLERRRLAEREEFTERFAAYDTKATRRALAATIGPLRR
jgi:CHAD domain-containing protein